MIRLETAQPKEQAAVATESASGDLGDLGHFYWPSEFPMAFCGAVSPYPTLHEAKGQRIRSVCDGCSRIAQEHFRASGRFDRSNPHIPPPRQQGG